MGIFRRKQRDLFQRQLTAAQARLPGGRVACWVLTHRVCSPRGEAELHPPALKWVTGSPRLLQTSCAVASAVPAGRARQKHQALDFSIFKMAVRTTRTPERHLQRPLSCYALSVQAPNGPVAAFSCKLSPTGESAVRCTPDGFTEGS